jgi:hypothetical protein
MSLLSQFAALEMFKFVYRKFVQRCVHTHLKNYINLQIKFTSRI